MQSKQVIQAVKDRLGEKIRELHVANPRRVYVTVDPSDIVEATRILHKDLGARFNIASGMQMERDFEVLYHFAFEQEAPHGVLVTVRVRLDHEEPVVDSVVASVPAALWIEREMSELLGIEFRNHPDMQRLLLAEDWPKGVYPLRRGRPWEGKVEKKL